MLIAVKLGLGPLSVAFHLERKRNIEMVSM